MRPEPGERVVFHGHPSWLSMPALYVKGVLGALAVGVLSGLASADGSGRVRDGWVVVAVLAVFMAVTLRGYLRRLRTTYTVTDRRLAIRTGLLACDVLETRLERIDRVNSRQTLLERLLGVGTLHFRGAAEAGDELSFRGVADPRDLARTVDAVLATRRGRAAWD
ncbi:MAG: PH domain-containing protein [Solirubrobacterales bacterium]|nr:PH domain-containing protein [Solirubrobacterales bacterium]MBV9715814.1 PH domain-containing protein [Solirubrobacterales bacterium]